MRSEAVEREEGSAIYDGVPDTDNARKADKLAIIDFVAAQGFDVIAEIAQEPVQSPQCTLCAVQAGTETITGYRVWLKDCK